MRYLGAAVVAVILYGSLYPFDFQLVRGSPLDLLLASLRHPSSRGDIVANLLLYIPLGLLLRWPAAASILAGAALSLGIEVAQVYVPARTPSLWDVGLNAAGTAVGALARGFGRPLLGRAGLRIEDRGALLLAVAWPAARLAPFVPTLDWQKWKDALKPLLTAPAMPLDIVRHFVLWLVFAKLAAAALGSRRLLLPAFIAVELGRVVVVGRVLGIAEIVGGVLALLVPARRRYTPLVAAALAAMVVVEELRPFAFTAQRAAFHLVPFRGFLGGSIEVNVLSMLEKSFAYGGLVWLLWRSRLPLTAATGGTAAALLALEAVQTHLPGRVPEVTDALIALAIGAALAALSPQASRTSASVGAATHARQDPASGT